MVASFGDAALNDLWFAAHAPGGQPHLALELIQAGTAPVAQFHPLQMGPDPLVRVQVRRVAGQSLQPDAVGAAVRQKLLDRLAPMNGRAIPQDQELARNMPQQVAQEADHVGAAIGAELGRQQQLPDWGDRADGGYVVTGERHAQHRRLAPGRIGPDGGGQEVEAGLIYPDEGAAFGRRPLFRVGQRSPYQWAMAASSRWVARTIGCCTLQPMRARSRLTWAG
jgi:hypothetical protein